MFQKYIYSEYMRDISEGDMSTVYASLYCIQGQDQKYIKLQLSGGKGQAALYNIPITDNSKNKEY